MGSMRNKKYLKFIKWINEFNKYCDLLFLSSKLTFNDLYELYLLDWEPGFLVRSLEREDL